MTSAVQPLQISLSLRASASEIPIRSRMLRYNYVEFDIELTHAPGQVKDGCRDRTVKRQLYQRQGVAEYWVVDLDAKQVEVWRFAAGMTEPERHVEVVPVRLRDCQIGEFSKIFDWPG